MNLRFPTGTRRRAFSLLEVMVAIAIFSVASFAILSLISSSLANVRRLQRPMVDASPVLARFAATNKLVEGIYSGSLGDPELLGKEYQGYNWTASIEPYQQTNNLFIVECVVQSASGNHEVISQLSTLLYKPDSSSPPGPFDRSIGIKGQ